MKFWVYSSERHQALGPFSIEQLKKLPDFSPETMIAPENAQAQDSWKAAKHFEEMRALFLRPPPPPGRKAPPPPRPIEKAGRRESVGARPSVPMSPGPPAPAASTSSARHVASAQRGRKTWVPAALGAAALLLLLTLGIRTLGPKRTSRPTALPTPTPIAPQPERQTQPELAPDPWAGREQEAVDFAKTFPARNALYPRCPRRIEDVPDGLGKFLVGAGGIGEPVEIGSWSKVRTIQDGFECGRLMPVALMAEMATKLKKLSPEEASAMVREEMRADLAAFAKYERKVNVSWTANREAGPRYRVTAEVKLSATVALENETKHHTWTVDLQERTLKPLCWGSWFEVDARAAGAWGDAEMARNPQFGRGNDDTFDVSAVAPTYAYTQAQTDKTIPVINAMTKTPRNPHRRPSNRRKQTPADRSALPGMGKKGQDQPNPATPAGDADTGCQKLRDTMDSTEALTATVGADRAAEMVLDATANFDALGCEQRLRGGTVDPPDSPGDDN